MHLPTIVDSWMWPSFIGGVLGLIILDLLVFHKSPKELTFKQAAGWSVFWIVLALSYNLWFGFQYGTQLGIEFVTGYLVELSLSVDNLFVMLLIFKAFGVPSKFQHRVLFWGIMGAIVFRGVLIIVGVDLIHKFDWLMFVFGAILIFSGGKLLFESDEEKDVMDSFVVRLFRKFVPMSTTIESERFFTHVEGKKLATPLLLVLALIEVTDIVFAVDSIPAVLAVTKDAFVAFASNILALLGLRSLYFVLADWIGRFRYLKPGLAVILTFVGVKMIIAQAFGFHMPSWISLTVIIGVLLTAGLTSWYVNRKSILDDKQGK